MISTLAVLSALAQDEFDYIEEEELFDYLGVIPTGESPTPDGVFAEWASARGVVEVIVANSGTDMLQIDWNQSSFVDENKEAFGIVPSKVRQIDVEKLVAPDVVPPGASVRVYLFRESRDGEPDALYDTSDLGKRIAISLALVRNSSVSWLNQEFLVDYTDRAALVALDACRAETAMWRQTESATLPPKRTHDWGLGLAGAGLLIGGLAAIPPYMGEDALLPEDRLVLGGLGGGTSAVGGLLVLLSTKDLRRTRADFAAAGPMPDCP